jgi:hypothetical protein
MKGLVLRPLSAKYLPVTIPEEKGLVNRDILYDFSGLRKPQMALAKAFGLTEYSHRLAVVYYRTHLLFSS